MLRKHMLNETAWYDLEHPTRDEILFLIESHNIPMQCAEELMYPSLRSKVDAYPNTLYLVLHFPDKIQRTGPMTEKEIDFVIGYDFVATIRYTPHDTLEHLGKTIDVEHIVGKTSSMIHGGHLFYIILRSLYRKLMEELESTAKRIRIIEDDIFHDKEAPMVRELSNANRVLLDLKQPLGFHREILRSFEKESIALFGNEYMTHAHLLLGEFYRVEWMIESSRNLLRDLRETNDSLLQSKNNDIIQKLTLMSFVTFPLSLIAGIFGMNAVLPFVESPKAFWIILFVMLLGAFSMYLYFKKKHWL